MPRAALERFMRNGTMLKTIAGFALCLMSLVAMASLWTTAPGLALAVNGIAVRALVLPPRRARWKLLADAVLFTCTAAGMQMQPDAYSLVLLILAGAITSFDVTDYMRGPDIKVTWLRARARRIAHLKRQLKAVEYELETSRSEYVTLSEEFRKATASTYRTL